MSSNTEDQKPSRWRTEAWVPDDRRWVSSSQTWAAIALVRLARGEAPDAAFERLDHDQTMFWIGENHKNAGLAASAFTYLTRRFGPPTLGCDDYKELGAWHLTTPSPGLVVRIAPKGASISVGPCNVGVVDHYEPTNEVLEAVKATLVDLLSPVCVRDLFINVAGRRDAPEPPEEEVAYFRWAGCGVAPAYWNHFAFRDGLSVHIPLDVLAHLQHDLGVCGYALVQLAGAKGERVERRDPDSFRIVDPSDVQLDTRNATSLK